MEQLLIFSIPRHKVCSLKSEVCSADLRSKYRVNMNLHINIINNFLLYKKCIVQICTKIGAGMGVNTRKSTWRTKYILDDWISIYLSKIMSEKWLVLTWKSWCVWSRTLCTTGLATDYFLCIWTLEEGNRFRKKNIESLAKFDSQNYKTKKRTDGRTVHDERTTTTRHGMRPPTKRKCKL